MDQTDQRPAKRSIFEQGGPKQKKMSKFDQKLFSRSPPTPIPRIPISNSAPVSPIEEGASSDVREPPSSQRADDDTPESISQESPPDALGISGLDSQKLTSANMDVEGSNRATGADADAGKMRKMEVLRGSPPPLVTILPDIYPIEEDLETSSTVKSTRVQCWTRNGRPEVLWPKDFALAWARDYLLPIDIFGHVPLLTESFDFAENVKFIPMTTPYAERLDKPYYSPSSQIAPSQSPFLRPSPVGNDPLFEPFLPGCPFPERYPYAGNISWRHQKLQGNIAVYRNQKIASMTKAERQAASRSQFEHRQTGLMNAPEVNRLLATSKRSLTLDSSVIQSNMQFLLNECSPVSDKNFDSLHYAPSQKATLKKMQETTLSTNSDHGTNNKCQYPTHEMQQFQDQRAESAAAAEDQGEASPPKIFTYVEYNEMGEKTFTIKTQAQVNADYHTMLKKDGQTFDDIFILNELQIDHDEGLKNLVNCQYCSQSKPSFGIDPPNTSWTTDASKKPVPREGEPDIMFGPGEEDWEAAFIDYGDNSLYQGAEDTDADQLMEGY